MNLNEQIALYYPQYHDIQHYPSDKVALIMGNKDEWGIFGNFFPTPIVVNGVMFDCTERLFHIMKFNTDAREGIVDIYHQPPGLKLKMHMKPMYKKHPEWFREDWGQIVVDTLRFCLQTKYEQCEIFRNELQRSADLGLFIAEKAHKKTFDSYSVILYGNEYVGPNLLGRLLMELRDNGQLDYHLPENALNFINILSHENQHGA